MTLEALTGLYMVDIDAYFHSLIIKALVIKAFGFKGNL
jgi:hypothetical protein